MDYTKINSNDQLDLKGSCLIGCTADSSLAYTYNIYLFNSPLNQWIPFTNSSYYRRNGHLNSDITILKDLFEDFPSQTIWKIELIINVLYTNNQSYSGYVSMKIYVNFSPRPGTCDISPRVGTTNTLFFIYCDQWTDADSGSISSFDYYGRHF